MEPESLRNTITAGSLGIKLTGFLARSWGESGVLGGANLPIDDDEANADTVLIRIPAALRLVRESPALYPEQVGMHARRRATRIESVWVFIGLGMNGNRSYGNEWKILTSRIEPAHRVEESFWSSRASTFMVSF